MSNFYFLVQLIRSLTAPRLRCAEQLTLVKIAPTPKFDDDAALNALAARDAEKKAGKVQTMDRSR